MSTIVTIRLEDDVKDRLDRLATSTQRSKSFLAAEAIKQFIDLNEWQISEVEVAVKEADAGDFASEAEMDEFEKKWGRRVR